MTQTKEKTFEIIYIKKKLGTRGILQECIERLGTDVFDRKAPAFQVIHKALEMYRDSLKGGE